MARKTWIINAFTMNASSHMAPGLWRHPNPDHRHDHHDLASWIELAQQLDRAHFDGLFLADTLGLYDVYRGPRNPAPALAAGAQAPYGDPLVLVAALAHATTSLALVVTASVTYETPFVLARRLSTLDHLTRGRVGWNIVTSHLASAARNCGLVDERPHDERYARADEFMRVVYKLWEGSWRDDAVVRDPRTGVYIDPARVRAIDHGDDDGHYFRCAGPHAVDPSPQRTPLLFQAGMSRAGQAFAAQHAEVLFLPGMTPAAVRTLAEAARAEAARRGRPPGSLQLLAGMLVIVDATDALAQQKYQTLLARCDLDGVAALFGGWTGTDLAAFADDEDFAFVGPGAVQSLVAAWSPTVPDSEGSTATAQKWTKSRILRELAMSGAHPRIVGGPRTVADALQRWIDEGGIDGFNFSHATLPGTYADMERWLWPELRARGVLRTAAPGSPGGRPGGSSARETYRGDGLGARLRPDHPGAAYTWRAGEPAAASWPGEGGKEKREKGEGDSIGGKPGPSEGSGPPSTHT